MSLSLTQQRVRKTVHLVLALLMAAAGIMVGKEAVLLVGMGLLVAFMGAKLVRVLSPSLHIHAISHGAFFYAIGVLLTALVFLPASLEAFVAGLLVLALADPAACLIGMSWRTRTYRVFGETRSYGGSFACLLVSTLVFLPFVGLPFATVGALLVTMVEAYAPQGSDNLLLPLVAAFFVAVV